MCDFYEILYNDFNYYHYQPGSNMIYIAYISRTHAHTRTHMHTLAHTHTRTHAHTHPPTSRFRLSLFDGPNHNEVNAPFSPVPLAMNDRSLLHSNKQSRMRLGIRDIFGCFRVYNLVPDIVFNVLYIDFIILFTIVLVNVKRFRALCGFYAIENKLLLIIIIIIKKV